MSPLRTLSGALLVFAFVACGDSGSGGSNDGGSSDGGASSGGSPNSGGGPANGGGDTGGGAPTGEPPEVAGITAEHNIARANVDPPAATPMPPLEWSDDLYQVALAYANVCVFEHSGNEYGENLYATSGQATPKEVVDAWVSEVADYDYETNECSGLCGHYTQVVWAESLRVGCAVAFCNENSPFGSGSWEHWVCNYDPPGNWVGEKPY